MIDTGCEMLVRVTESPHILNPAAPPSISTVWRWILCGLKNGVRLESVKVGGVRYTSREACNRFLVRLNTPNSLPESPTAAAEQAGRDLEELGV
jgi:hypothetical protein